MSTSKVKVIGVRKGVEKWDTFYTLKPLIFILRIIGLSCVHKEENVLKSGWSWLKITFLVLLLGFVNACNIYHVYIWDGEISLSFSSIIQIIFVFDYIQYLIDLFFVHKYGRDRFLQYVTVYEHVDKILEITYYSEIRRSIICVLVFITTIYITTAIIDFITLLSVFGVLILVSYTIDYLFIVLRNLTILDVIAQITQVSYRLRGLGDILKGSYLITETFPGVKDVVVEKERVNKIKRMNISVPKIIRTIDQFEFLISKLSNCYLMILEQCDFINNAYGARILLTNFNCFVSMIILLNVAIRVAMGHLGQSFTSIKFVIFSTLMRTLALALVLICKVYKCEQNYIQIKRIIRYVDHLLVNKKISLAARDHLISFRDLVQSRPLQFQAATFYKLDCVFLLSIASAVVTYTLILLQYFE